MVQTSGEWEDVVDRIGRWVDFKGALQNHGQRLYGISLVGIQRTLRQGQDLRGRKVLMYCTLDATPLSKAEVTMDAGAYQDVTDPSVYVKFRLNDENPTEFYFVRHGQTDWNKSNKIMGLADIELNDSGKQEAHEVAELLKDETFDVIVTSPLKRAKKKTAEAIAEYHQTTLLKLPMRSQKEILGEYEGQENDGEYFGLWNYGGDVIEKGETTKVLKSRIFSF